MGVRGDIDAIPVIGSTPYCWQAPVQGRALAKQAQPADTNGVQREVLAHDTFSAAMQELRRQPGSSTRLLTINHRRPDVVDACRTTESTSECGEEARRHG
jgi:hypothetical protein